MAAQTTPESIKQISYVAAILKAPRMSEDAHGWPTKLETPAGP